MKADILFFIWMFTLIILVGTVGFIAMFYFIIGLYSSFVFDYWVKNAKKI